MRECQFTSCTQNISDNTTAGCLIELYGTAAPTGTANMYGKGNRMINTNPSATGSFLWICTTAGTPGTWTGVTIP
jgi:hypothetical protein